MMLYGEIVLEEIFTEMQVLTAVLICRFPGHRFCIKKYIRVFRWFAIFKKE